MPSKLDLVAPEPLTFDEEDVVKHFLGKSRTEFQQMLEERRGFSTEDFMWMRPGGLEYYLPCVLKYLRGKRSKGDTECARGIVVSLYFQATTYDLPKEVWSTMRQVAQVITSHPEKYGIDESDREFGKYVKELK